MSVNVLQNIREAIGNLNPDEIRRHTERPLRLFLYAHSERAYTQMEGFLAPPELSKARRAEADVSMAKAWVR